MAREAKTERKQPERAYDKSKGFEPERASARQRLEENAGPAPVAGVRYVLDVRARQELRSDLNE